MSRLVRNRFDEALPWFERVLAYDDLERTRIYGASQNNAGICFARLGQFDRAVAAQQRAVEIHDRSGRKTELMQAVGELGTTYLLQDEVALAVPHLQRALSIATEAGLVSRRRRLGAQPRRGVGLDRQLGRGRRDTTTRRGGSIPRTEPGKLAFSTATAAQIADARGDSQEASRLFNEVLATAAAEPSLQWLAHEGLAKLAVKANQPRSPRVISTPRSRRWKRRGRPCSRPTTGCRS